MLTRLFFIGAILCTFPSLAPAWDLSAAQEGICRQIGTFALKVGEARDIPMPRPQALQIVEQADTLSPGDRTMFTGVVYWVYEHPELSGTELYVPMITACRNEFAQRHVAEMQSQRHTEASSVCEHMGNVGVIMAKQAATMSQAQTLAHWRTADANYAAKAAHYNKWVAFVYARRRLAPTALRVAVTQECLNGLAIDLETQQGVRR